MTTMITTHGTNYPKPPSPAASSTVCADRKKTKYHPLNTEAVDQVNVYGVIIDAAYPVQSSKGKWICSLKVIDGTNYSQGDERQKHTDYSVIIIYASRFEDCPIVRQIGDIIRVHRANVKNYKGRKQFHVNVQFNASWSLFETNPKHALKGNDSQSDTEMRDDQGEDGEQGHGDYDPYKYSNKNYSLDLSVHKSIVKGLRKWSIDYFANNMCVHISNYTALAQVSSMEKGKDIDLLVKVMKVHEKDEQTIELRIKDLGDQLWFLNLPKHRFGGILNIRAGEIIRVRSVLQDTTSRRNIITHKPTTNILKFLPSMKIVSYMKKSINEINDTDKMLLEDSSEVLMTAVPLTDIITTEEHEKSNDKEKDRFFRLQDLFLNFENLPEQWRAKNSFRTKFCVYRVDPEDAREIVVAACPKCHETTSCKDLAASGSAKCQTCKVPTKLIYQMQMLVKDTASQLNKNFYRVLLYSFDEGYGDKFFGMEPKNLYQDEQALVEIKRYLSMMTRFNVWIHAVLERKNQFFIIKDTKIKPDF